MRISLPRMRGDPPAVIPEKVATLVSTPHARGSTPSQEESHKWRIVYPACAGIHPTSFLWSSGKKSLPRMRGDPPIRSG